MIEFLKKLFCFRDQIQSLSVDEVQVLAYPRSSKWRKVRLAHLENNPRCAICGSDKNVVPHHIVPVHLDPDRELDPENLISLCESESFNCHLFFGHLKNWTRCNTDIMKDVDHIRNRFPN